MRQMTPLQISQLTAMPALQLIVDQTKLEPRQLIRFLNDLDDPKTLSQYIGKIRKLTPYTRPRDRDTTDMNKKFLIYQLVKQDQQDGGIAGCIQRIRENRIQNKLHIPKLEWIKEQWELKLDNERNMYNDIVQSK
jgi:hypothetical protein